MFCDTCIGALQHRRHLIGVTKPGDPGYHYHESIGPEYKFGHHKTCDSLIISATHQCPICQTVWNLLSNVEQGTLRAAETQGTNTSTYETSALEFITTAVLRRWIMPDKFSLVIRYSDKLFPDIYEEKYSLFILEPNDECTSAQSFPIRGGLTSDRTSSIESMQKAAMWLQDCVDSHPSCNIPERNSTWYPTRLLHLADSDGDEGYVRLIRTTQELPAGPYSTLSHRWGNSMPFQLTKAMESVSNPCFSVLDLPRTFQEAIQVSKELGIWYLWIDSLCIIQSGDNRQDWFREAILMDKVYTHSHCNISATDAEDSTKGLFRDRTPLYIGRPRIKVDLDGIQPNSKQIQCLMTDYLFWPHALMYSPLNKRGWVFQERYLVPRVLHFGRNQLFWECRGHTVCETFPHGLPLVNLCYIPSFLKSRESNELRVSELRYAYERIVTDANETNWERLWATLVWEYYKKELTVPGDKLVALSGVAKHLRSRIKDVYVAGMWRRNLEISLMWQVSSMRSRPPEYRAPSWSWASVDGVSWLESGCERQCLIHVEDVVLDHATDDSTGAVTGGWLDLRGCLKPMRLLGIKRNEFVVWHMMVDTSIVSEPHDGVAQEELSVCRLDTRHTEESAFDSDNMNRQLFFMPGFIEGGSGESPVLRCLLLRLVDFTNKTFERIGRVGYRSGHAKELLLAELDEETKARLPCLRYENGLHTIRII